ncbi:DUF2695 domain-containing protein [Nocardioides hwasunensis]|uniref:DUF2695 domain-containing protein n=1 Tax=Nocardioides hwasunensis TaxID=397258 RepID=A0ABR8MJA7_9ACTN|nr:DUF2695 domain-containing protein [Nocardioides hwasunensis]MBD3916137.1 DUF2695 domain-containing protein [Nocardioides hwasunensis]
MSSIDTEVESWLQGLATDLTDPRPGECLRCFVHRMLAEFGCRTTLRFATRYRDGCAPRALGLECRLGDRGGFCDCEIFVNGWEVDRRLWAPEVVVEHDGRTEVVEEADPPASLPACGGARRGSTQPCALWRVRRRWSRTMASASTPDVAP